MSWGNRDYWKSRRGDLYAEQQEVRRRSGQRTYELQESWLLAHLAERTRATRPVRVLDFGVGFGRMARLLAGCPGVDYYGFDVSPLMVAPLLRSPPEGLPDIAQRILVADRLPEAGGDRKFDIIFSVSVLIHNTPEQAKLVLGDMLAALAPDGEIWLVENLPVLFSMLDNVWHEGCWVHDIAYSTAPDLDVDIDVHSVPGHGIYRLRAPASGQDRRVTRRETGGATTLLTRESYVGEALARTEQAVRGLESEISGIGPGVGQARDDAELYRRANVMAADALAKTKARLTELPLVDGSAPISDLLTAVDHLVEKLNQSEQRLEERERELGAAERARASGEEALRRRQVMLRALVLPDREPLSIDHVPIGAQQACRQPDATMQFDSDRDTRMAQTAPGFERVCHVMHQEWFGIRAAAGALPGRKLAISAMRPPSASEIDRAAASLSRAGVDRIVVHGFSESMASLVKALRTAGYERISLVWHGAPVMWMHEPERRLFFLALSMAKKGYLRRIQGMRAGTDAVLGRWGWPKQLLNMPPKVDLRPRPARVRDGAVALAPSWNLLHKNLTTNVLGAIEAVCVDEVWVLAEDFALPPDLHRKVKVLPKLDQRQMLDTMRLADLVLNASIVDCHPMVELEALAVGTPALRGRLSLDALDDHPYVRLTEVHDPLNIREVANRISGIHTRDRTELEGMMDDYAKKLVMVSAERYSEFLEF